MTDNCIHGVALDETCVLCCRNSARQYRNQRDDCKRDLEAANIEVAHLREAFMTMEKAYNALALRTCDNDETREYVFTAGWQSARQERPAEYQETEHELRHSAYLYWAAKEQL